MPQDKLSELKPSFTSCKDVDSIVQQFVDTIIPQTRWSLLPFKFLYDLYVAWFARNDFSGKPMGRNAFVKTIQDIADTGKIPGFKSLGPRTAIRSKNLMCESEPLVVEYDLSAWMSDMKSTYTGLIRETCQV